MPSWTAWAISRPDLLGDEVERHVDPGGDARRGDHLAVLDVAAADGVGAVLAQRLQGEPVPGRALALEQAGGAEHQRARADRGRPFRRPVDPAEPAEDLLVLEHRPIADAAGDEDDVGLLDFGDRAVGDQAEPAFGTDLALLLGDELDVPFRDVAHDFVGPDRVLGGQLVEYEDRDFHADDVRGPGGVPSRGRNANIR